MDFFEWIFEQYRQISKCRELNEGYCLDSLATFNEATLICMFVESIFVIMSC